jgi:hypothetical protein
MHRIVIADLLLRASGSLATVAESDLIPRRPGDRKQSMGGYPACLTPCEGGMQPWTAASAVAADEGAEGMHEGKTPADMERFVGPGLRAYFRIARVWKLTFREQRLLLGDPAFVTFLRWKLTHTGAPGVDVIYRISYVLGIFKALAILLPRPNADDWIRRPNAYPMFGGRSALEFVLDEGMLGLHRVRAYLDSVTEGYG